MRDDQVKVGQRVRILKSASKAFGSQVGTISKLVKVECGALGSWKLGVLVELDRDWEPLVLEWWPEDLERIE